MPRIEASSVAEHRALIETRLLDAFGAEMDCHGFAGINLAAVAARAGISRSAIYNYVTDKNDLMLRFVDREVAQFVERMRAETAGMSSARERLLHLVETQIRRFAHEPGAGSSSGMLHGASLPPEVFGAMMERLSAVHAMIREALLDGERAGEFRRFGDVDVVVEMIGAAIGSQRMAVGTGERSVDDVVASVRLFVEAAVSAR